MTFKGSAIMLEKKKVRYGRSTTTIKKWLNSVMSVELKPTCPKSNNTNKY